MTDLIRLSHGIWRPTGDLAHRELLDRTAALLSVCGADAVICSLTAARLHGFWLPMLDDQAPIDVIVRPSRPVPSTRGWNKRSEIRSHRRILAPDEITNIHGLPVTTEARTWFDLAAVFDMADLVAAGDFVLRGTTVEDDLRLIVKRAPHRPGVIRARRALPLLDARSRSRPESHLRYGLVAGGLPKPRVNEPIFDPNGGWLAEPDLSYDDARLALEYNGADHENRDRMRHDITRGVDMSLGQWRTETFGPLQVFQRIDQVVALVRQLRYERLGGRDPH